MRYDLHIHSGLSPCADDDMSPNNLIQMALLNKLELISVTDHNSLAQQKVIHELALKNKLQYWFGVELNTQEDVHCLAYFGTLEDMTAFDKALQPYVDPTPNDPNIFGHQWIYDNEDTPIEEVTPFLLMGLHLSLDASVNLIHQHHGKAVLAHLYGRENGIIQQLGFIPESLAIDGVEVTSDEHEARFLSMYPQLSHLPIFHSSDAHRLDALVTKAYDLPKLDWFGMKP